VRLLVVSDPHFAGPGEQQRRGYEARAIRGLFQRTLAKAWRRWFWLREPMDHNDKLDAILRRNPDPDIVVANGDYTVNSAFIGISDDAACESAELCLAKLRDAYGNRLLAGIGDHELGKHSLFGGVGGPRFESWTRVGSRLGLTPWWRRDFGHYSFIAVPSTLVALPVFEPELLTHEIPLWHAERHRVLGEIAAAFATIPREQQIVLFCHDPTALPFLREVPEVSACLSQLEATVIGHLHTPAILGLARKLAGLPEIRWAGSTARRYSGALRKARSWDAFRIQFCPSPAGVEAFKDGGWLTAEFDPAGVDRPRWTRHRLPWRETSVT
jgi:hypothetical protein